MVKKNIYPIKLTLPYKKKKKVVYVTKKVKYRKKKRKKYKKKYRKYYDEAKPGTEEEPDEPEELEEFPVDQNNPWDSQAQAPNSFSSTNNTVDDANWTAHFDETIKKYENRQ